MRNISTKCLAIILALLISIPAMPTVLAQTPEARSISIFRVDGTEVSLARGVGGREIEPRAGQRLVEGNILTTGWDSQVYLQMDHASILKMDESTWLQIGSARSLLSITIQSGGALVDVTGQEIGQTMETRIGNTSIAVRGTMYIISRRDTDVVTITMLSGLGEVTMLGGDGLMVEIPLPAGFVMWIYDVYEDAELDGDREIIEQTYRISALDIYELGLFELEEIIYRQEYLIEAGVVTPEMIEEAQEFIEVLREEREAAREAYLLADEEETVRVMLPGEEIAEPEQDELRDDETTETGPDYTGYITIRGVRISTALNILNLNLLIGGHVGLSATRMDGWGWAYGFTDEEIAPLRYMTNLWSLSIQESYISDLELFVGMESLTFLYLDGNRIEDLTPLGNLENLRYLFLDMNNISNTTPLANLMNLSVLGLGHNQISSLSSLADMANLTELNLINNEISDLTPLAGLVNLNRLVLHYNNVSSLTGLENLTNLEFLLMADNYVSDLMPLAGLINLRSLFLLSNDVSSLSGLENLHNLESLNLSLNNVHDVTPLAGLSNLTNLHLRFNNIASVAPLAGMTNLAVLELADNPAMVDLHTLAHMAGSLDVWPAYVMIGGRSSVRV